MMTLKRKKAYQIVQFTVDNAIDCVPLIWISLDPESLQLVTKFMSPPYTKKGCKDFHKLVKAAKHPEDSWPTYTITLIDEADSYTEALKKIEALKLNEYIYTTDCDDLNDEISKLPLKKPLVNTTVIDMDGKKRKRKDSTSDTSESDISDDTNQYSSEKISCNIQCRSIKKNMKSKPIITENVLLSKNLVPTASSSKECVGLKPIDESSNIQIPMDSYNVLLNYLQSIVAGTERIKNEQFLIRNEIRKISNTLDRNITRENLIDSPMHWMEQYEIELPLRSVEKFKQLCLLLKDNDIKNQCIIIMNNTIDVNTNLSKNVLAIIPKFFHRDLAMKYTCVKKIKNKKTLKPSLFCDCIKDLFLTKSRNGKIVESNLCEKTFDKVLGPIFTNSKDWNKGRFLDKDSKENDTADTEENDINAEENDTSNTEKTEPDDLENKDE